MHVKQKLLCFYLFFHGKEVVSFTLQVPHPTYEEHYFLSRASTNLEMF